MNEHGDGWFDAERAICIDEMEKAAGSEKHGDLVELYNSTFYGCEDSGVGEHALASAPRYGLGEALKLGKPWHRSAHQSIAGFVTNRPYCIGYKQA